MKFAYHQFACRKRDHNSSTLQYHQVDAVDPTDGEEFIHDTAKQLRDVWLASLVVLLPASHESDEIGILDIDRRCDVAERQNFVHLEARSNVVDW